MPNYCDNIATISGPAEVIGQIKTILEDPKGELLNYMVPEPKDNESWYEWRVENWGTKWDISDVYLNDEDTENNSIEFGFSSAWSPPTQAFETWARGQEGVTFTLKYFEPGVGFLGEATYDGEYYDDNYIDSQSDATAYKDFARDEWGWEDEEEPEPFTEWYKQGVEEKGLTDD